MRHLKMAEKKGLSTENNPPPPPLPRSRSQHNAPRVEVLTVCNFVLSKRDVCSEEGSSMQLKILGVLPRRKWGGGNSNPDWCLAAKGCRG